MAERTLCLCTKWDIIGKKFWKLKTLKLQGCFWVKRLWGIWKFFFNLWHMFWNVCSMISRQFREHRYFFLTEYSEMSVQCAWYHWRNLKLATPPPPAPQQVFKMVLVHYQSQNQNNSSTPFQQPSLFSDKFYFIRSSVVQHYMPPPPLRRIYLGPWSFEKLSYTAHRQ